MTGNEFKEGGTRKSKPTSGPKGSRADQSLLDRLAQVYDLDKKPARAPLNLQSHAAKRAQARPLPAKHGPAPPRTAAPKAQTHKNLAPKAAATPKAVKAKAARPAAEKRMALPTTAAAEPRIAEPLSAPVAPTTTPSQPPKPAPTSLASEVIARPDFDAFALNMAKLAEETGRAVTAYMKPQEGRRGAELASQIEDAVRTLGQIAEYWWSDPKRSLEVQSTLSGDFLSLWANTLRRLGGENAPAVAPLDPSDKRFADPEWARNPVFDFLRQSYSLSAQWLADLVERADVDDRTREKAQFYIRQIVSALSPSNFVATNPELIRETLQRNGANLVNGMRMLAEDIEAGHGQLRIRHTDSSRFQLGVDMAATPGKVIFRNDLIELLQYAPSTEQVFKRPLLVVPPWINKYYVLDLNPEKSFVRWAVSQGLTLFMISWVNPDERHSGKDFAAYMREGVFAALDAIEKATGERQMTALGYCVGGTLLAATLAYMRQVGDDRVACASFLTTQTDFKDSGDLKLFIDEARVHALEESMKERGYLEGSQMASAFNMLRPTELIWNYVVNNYLKGKDPAPFDLLAWNSDSTRMPTANHSFYLRNCYLENRLARGEMEIEGRRLNLKAVKAPIYTLAAKEDHIAPARSVFAGARLFGGPVRFVMAGSGHIAGVVNPVSKPRYQYWTGPDPKEVTFEDWLLATEEHKGTWWPDWIAWLEAQAPEKVPARAPGDGALKPLADAPGDYVRMRS